MNYKTLAITTSLLSTLLLVGCGDSDSGIPLGGDSGNANNPITAPTAGNIAFSALGGSATTASAANGILSVGNPNTATVVNVQSPTTLGGSVVANADGSFTYNAPALGNATDTFSYTIQNAGGSATGTVTVTLLGRTFFVNNQAAAGGTGTQQAPFQNLAQAQAASAGVNGAEIVVFQGDGTNNGYNTAFALGANQTLRGFSQSATPLMTGPVNFSSGNRLEDVRISGTPGVASAVNAVGASNGIINRVAISNCTSAGNLTDATGTWTISNGSTQNLAASGFSSSSSTGSLTWSIINSTFTNTTLSSVFENPTGTAVHNLTVGSCSFIGGTFSGTGINANVNTNGTVVGLNVNNCTIDGRNSLNTGIFFQSFGNTALTELFSGNNITGCTGAGISSTTVSNGTTRAKFSGNRTLGNRLNRGLVAGAGLNATLCAIFENNTSDAYELNRIAPANFSIELFATFGSRNVGQRTGSGTLTDVAAGTCGLP
jgi:trimeric autotransporter adhesin